LEIIPRRLKIQIQKQGFVFTVTLNFALYGQTWFIRHHLRFTFLSSSSQNLMQFRG